MPLRMSVHSPQLVYGRHFGYVRKLVGKLRIGVVVPGLKGLDFHQHVPLVPVVGPVIKNDQVRVCVRAGPQPIGNWVDIVTVIFDELVPRVGLPQAGLHVGDVLGDKPGDPRYVVLSDCEIPY